MILMGLTGVSKEDIVANYEVTHTYLKENVKLRLEDGLEELEFSKPQWIEKAYDHIIEHYGSFKVYLMAVGLLFCLFQPGSGTTGTHQYCLK